MQIYILVYSGHFSQGAVTYFRSYIRACLTLAAVSANMIYTREAYTIPVSVPCYDFPLDGDLSPLTVLPFSVLAAPAFRRTSSSSNPATPVTRGRGRRAVYPGGNQSYTQHSCSRALRRIEKVITGEVTV